MQYKTAGCTFEGGSGAYADPLTSYSVQPEYVAAIAHVEGREANLIRYRASEPDPRGSYFAGIVVPLTSTNDFDVSVTLYAWCANPEMQAEAAIVLQTLTIAAQQ